MVGTTYSRTTGKAILPRTWAYVRKHPHVPRADVLLEDEREQYDEGRQDNAKSGEVNSSTQASSGISRFVIDTPVVDLVDVDGVVRHGLSYICGFSHAQACELLGIPETQLWMELDRFVGGVSVVRFVPGQRFYQSIGLNPTDPMERVVTTDLLAAPWEDRCPNTYANAGEWCESVAALADWNGQCGGFLEAELSSQVVGLVGAQRFASLGPGGRYAGVKRICIPTLSNASLLRPIGGRRIGDVLRTVRFGSTA